MDLQTPPKPLARALAALERFVFGRRLLVLTVLAAFTLLMGFFALQLRMTAGFEKQMPVGHEYVTTFQQYRNQLFGANGLTIAVRSIDGTIWTKQGLTRLYDVTKAIVLMPNLDRVGLQSLLTSHTWINDTTPEGFKIERLTPDTLEHSSLTP